MIARWRFLPIICLLILAISLLPAACGQNANGGLTATSASSTSPGAATPLITSPAFPAGRKLDIEVRQGTGTAYAEGISFSEPVFTVMELTSDTFSGFLGPLKAGYKFIGFRVFVKNTSSRLLDVVGSAEGFNSAGESVSKSFYFDAVFNDIKLEPGQGDFASILLSWSEAIKYVKLNANLFVVIPGTPTPASELYTIVFSRDWLLKNDADPSPIEVNITFPEEWLTNSPPLAAGEIPVTFTFPKEAFTSHNSSKIPGQITVTFPNAFFQGLD